MGAAQSRGLSAWQRRQAGNPLYVRRFALLSALGFGSAACVSLFQQGVLDALSQGVTVGA